MMAANQMVHQTGRVFPNNPAAATNMRRMNQQQQSSQQQQQQTQQQHISNSGNDTVRLKEMMINTMHG